MPSPIRLSSIISSCILSTLNEKLALRIRLFFIQFMNQTVRLSRTSSISNLIEELVAVACPELFIQTKSAILFMNLENSAIWRVIVREGKKSMKIGRLISIRGPLSERSEIQFRPYTARHMKNAHHSLHHLHR